MSDNANGDAAEKPVTEAQADSAPEALGGSGLQEPEWDVEVSLSDLQNNQATPFGSATTWQDLGLLVSKHLDNGCSC